MVKLGLVDTGRNQINPRYWRDVATGHTAVFADGTVVVSGLPRSLDEWRQYAAQREPRKALHSKMADILSL
jgi:hypothetical protein